MAQVWEASDEVLARRVAVKLLHPHLVRDQSFVARFRGEAIAAARLTHPSIVSVYDTCSEDGLEAIVMELVVGTTMRADLDQHGPMRLEAVLAIGTQVADALGTAHAAGLVHRDVKPANILLSADGRVLVADFGIAKAAEGNDLTTEGLMIGTAKYLAPEQVEGTRIDHRADLYALGVVLYEALTGVAPFVAETDTATALARLRRDPVPPSQLRSGIPRAVEAVVLQAMNRNPDHRFASAAAMRTALLSAGADPRQAPAVAAAAAAQSGEHRAVRPPLPAPAPPSPGASSGPGPLPPAPPTPPPPPSAPAEPGAGPGAPGAASGGRRRTAAVIVVLLVVGAAVAALALAGGGGSGADGAPVAIASATSFDPQGDNGQENEDQVALLHDGDPTTAWHSETYRDPDAMAGKDGVGVVVVLERSVAVGSVSLATPDGGWAAEVWVGDGSWKGAPTSWGTPAGRATGTKAGTSRIDLDGTRGDHVLIWFTRVPDRGAMAVSEIEVRAR
jgi:hypothetical protein